MSGGHRPVEIRCLGRSGLGASVLGFGAMQLGDPRISEADAGRLLNAVLDMGVRLIDTARSYGLSEERIGRHIARRREEFVLSTKVGYGVEGVEDWTAECVSRGIDDARQRLQADVIDIVHLHSCPGEVLDGNGVLEALAEAREAGKIVAAAYSGDGPPLEQAVASGLVDSVQCSFNVCDRKNLDAGVVTAEPGIGVIAKRALAGVPWATRETVPGSAEAIYRDRFRSMQSLLPTVDDWADTALRFAAFRPGVHSVLCGSTSVEHIRSNLRSVEKGPLDAGTLAALDAAWARFGGTWDSVI